MHRKKWRSVQFLEGAHKHDLNIFYRQNIKVAQVEFCLTSINEQLPIYALVKSLAIRSLILLLNRLLLLLIAQTFLQILLCRSLLGAFSEIIGGQINTS